jgi:predicted N-formylglutamate amidohydrolase
MQTGDSTLLAAPEPQAYELLDVAPSVPVLIVCDHASRRIPESLGDLGVPSEYLHEHIAWDIGAGAVARSLSAILQLPAVLAGYSRLLVDCNRNLDDPSAFPEISDGIPVPGNQALSQPERQQRADAFYWPYHHAIRDRIRVLESLAPAPALLAVHSFTPALSGVSRPWHFGVMWDKDPRLASTLIQNLAAMEGIVVGDNQPYSGRHPADFTIDHHAEVEGLPHAGIEVRQDLVQTEAGVAEWSERLAQALAPILEDWSLYTNRAGGP